MSDICSFVFHPVEKEVSKVLEEFVKKAPNETLTRLSEALAADGVLKSSEKQRILEKNHTRGNRASCLADTVMDKGAAAWKKMIHHLQAVDAPLSSKLGLSSDLSIPPYTVCHY
uniref:CARD domain-containing protein n=1 Tax=Xiphophorus maculatus TaxID=8083 RepID=A0A3B5PVC7_XIPMA